MTGRATSLICGRKQKDKRLVMVCSVVKHTRVLQRAIGLLLTLVLAVQAAASCHTAGQEGETVTWMQPTRLYASGLQTLTAVVGNNWQTMPLLHLGNSTERLEIGFDEMSHEIHNYTCRVERCEWDWQPATSVFESDWLEGFSAFPVQDYRHSVNTTVDYTHYTIALPNEQCRITMSGNYRLLLFDSDSSDEEPVAEVRFMVLEAKTGVSLSVTTATDKDVNGRHQQLSAAVDDSALEVTEPERQLRTVVLQNWRLPRFNVRPTYQTGSGLRWEHEEQLIFLAGNEYHKFEILATSHPTMGVERMAWDGHRYEAFLQPTTPSPCYLTDEAAKGFSLVRNSDRRESDITCDYISVNYQLKAQYDGDRYVSGQWTNAAAPECYAMRYDQDSQSYRASILQKQGYYSYIYTDASGRPAPTEGHFFQTRNNYQMLVYYRPTGGRTWQLVGFCEKTGGK